jgi:hypothetical protein
MTKGWLVCLAVTGACLVPLPAAADHNGPSWKPEFGLEEGITFGGGNLIVSGITGQPALTPPNVSLYAGNTFFMQGYYRQAIGETGLSLKAAAGGVYVCQIASCADVLVDVIVNNPQDDVGNYESGSATGDLALEYAWDGGRVGIGRTVRAYNMVNSYSTVYAFQSVTLKPADGWFIEYEVGPLGLKYTHLIYHSSTTGYTLNASNAGIYLHFNYKDEDWYPGGKYFNQGMSMAKQTVAFVITPKEWGI